MFQKMQTWGRLIGHSNLPVGVNVSVDGCLSLYVSPVMTLQLVKCDPTFTRILGLPAEYYTVAK